MNKSSRAAIAKHKLQFHQVGMLLQALDEQVVSIARLEKRCQVFHKANAMYRLQLVAVRVAVKVVA